MIQEFRCSRKENPMLTTHRGVSISQKWLDTSERPTSVAIFPQKVRQSCTVAMVTDYRNKDVLARIKAELGVTIEKANELYADLMKFLWLAAVSPEPQIVPSPIIDDCWHCFVLFTQDYSDFCQNFFGGFLHHAPVRVGVGRITRPQLIPTIDAMHREFGCIPSSNWHYVPTSERLAA